MRTGRHARGAMLANAAIRALPQAAHAIEPYMREAGP